MSKISEAKGSLSCYGVPSLGDTFDSGDSGYDKGDPFEQMRQKDHEKLYKENKKLKEINAELTKKINHYESWLEQIYKLSGNINKIDFFLNMNKG